MKLDGASKRNRGLTLPELVMVLFILAFLILFVVGILPHPANRVKRISCIFNLKQVSLAYRIWEGDNGDLYPTGVSTNNGGARELAQTGDASAIFMVMSNELSTPTILWCPFDTNRFAATNFLPGFSNKNLSYFAGLDITNDDGTNYCLVGDDNFSVDGVAAKSGLLNISANSVIKWLPGRHVARDANNNQTYNVGNVAMGDGSVGEFENTKFQTALEWSGLATNHFVMP